MFHHFPGEPGVGRDCLVRSTDFTYSDEQDPADARNPVYTFLRAVTQTGYQRQQRRLSEAQPAAGRVRIHPAHRAGHGARRSTPTSLENLPIGLDGSAYRWTDLHGEGIPGILTEQAGAWFYKRNLSPIPDKLPDGRGAGEGAVRPARNRRPQTQRRPERRRGVHGPGRRRPARRGGAGRPHARPLRARRAPKAGSPSAPSPRA